MANIQTKTASKQDDIVIHSVGYGAFRIEPRPIFTNAGVGITRGAALGMPTRLRDAGVSKDQFDAIAEGSLENIMVRANPRPITSADQVREILEMAW